MAKKKQRTQGEIIVANIRYFMSGTEYKPEHMYLAARMSQSLWYQRMHNPEEFRISELLGIARKLEVPLSALLTEKEV